MPGRHDDRFPAEAVRDLLGLVRAIHAAAIARGAGPLDLRRIAAVEHDLEEAHGMGVSYPPNTIGGRSAFIRAEEAARRVADIVGMLDGAEPLVTAARARVTQAHRA